MKIEDRLAGAVWGHLIGDAVGVPYEFKRADSIAGVHFGARGTHHQPPGTWSDDGALMLALLDSLLRERAATEATFDTTDQAARFLAWADHGAYTPDGDGRFDIGGATASAFSRLREGVAPESAGGTGERDNGNGSLMRILPLALVGRECEDAELVDQAHRSSAITHGHPLAEAACAMYVLVARNLLAGAPRAEAIGLAHGQLRHAYHQRADIKIRLVALDELESWTARSGRGYVVDSFWSAWDAFSGAKDFRDTIERAIRYGNDTDTTAAIAGGLAGIRFGLAGIPAHWVAGMRGKEVVEPLVARLTGVAPIAPSTTASVRTHRHAPAGARTSAMDPLRVDWVDLKAVPALRGAPGSLGMTFAPGKHDLGRAGRHWRDLEADVARLHDHHGATRLVLLVEDAELGELAIPGIADVVGSHDVGVTRLPIPDQGVPVDEPSTRRLIAEVLGWVRDGERVVVACRGGLGRTGTVVALVLRDAGLGPNEAMALTRRARRGTIENRTQEAFVAAWQPAAVSEAQLPFARYRGGGRTPLGRPSQGDLTARHGYGPPVFKECGYVCVYCGLDMAASFENWLQLSVDHVVPRQMKDAGFDAALVEDITNLVTCCRPCNDFGNRYTVSGGPPATADAFYDLRDRVFARRKATILAKRERERAVYAKLPASGPDRPPTAGEDA